MTTDTKRLYQSLTPIIKKIKAAKTMKTLHTYQKQYDVIYKKYLDSKKK
jgi:hypothetical protein